MSTTPDVPLQPWIPLQPVLAMTQTFVLNSLTPKRTRYIKRKDLEDFLKREFKGYGALDFQIEVIAVAPDAIPHADSLQHINDRWRFYAPEIVTEVCLPMIA